LEERYLSLFVHIVNIRDEDGVALLTLIHLHFHLLLFILPQPQLCTNFRNLDSAAENFFYDDPVLRSKLWIRILV
jgi:hypothetical protein